MDAMLKNYRESDGMTDKMLSEKFIILKLSLGELKHVVKTNVLINDTYSCF